MSADKIVGVEKCPNGISVNRNLFGHFFIVVLVVVKSANGFQWNKHTNTHKMFFKEMSVEKAILNPIILFEIPIST